MSGVLEAYVLGELSDRENILLQENLAKYVELREELGRIEEAQEQLLMHTAIAPPAYMRPAIIRQLEDRSEAKVYTLARGSNVWQYAAAACIAVALISSFVAYNFYSKWQKAEGALQQLVAQNAQIAKEYNTVNQQRESIETDLNIISNPAFTRVVMKGTDNSPSALASVYWNKKTDEVYLKIQNLQTLAQGHQYQLWAIVEGKPVDAGVFDVTTSSLFKMKAIKNAAAFAVTIEPTGGSIHPTLATMQTVGNT